MKMIAHIFVVLLWPIANEATAQYRTFSTAKVDAAVRREMREQNLVGVAIGVIREFEIAYLQGYGYADVEAKKEVSVESVFNWASNSKPVIAIAAMQLVQSGQLDLEAPISRYLPDLPSHLSSITSRQLLCHQSGIPHYANGRIVSSGKQVRVNQELDPAISIHRFLQSPLIYRPGTQSEYSSYAYVLLSAVVQSAGKQPIQEHLDRRIIQPLGLRSFQLDLPADGQLHWVKGYRSSGGHPVEIADTAHFWKHGAGGYKSNVNDFARFAIALGSKRLINAQTTNIMWKNQTTSDNRLTGRGLGVMVEGVGRSLKVSHSGSQDETRTRMVLYPNQRHGVVVMCNTQGADPGKISTAIYQALRQ